MPSLISSLGKTAQRQLLEDLNYLNQGEIKAFCRIHSIPHAIWIETEAGRQKTSEDDRKGVILNRIRHYLTTGKVLDATCFAKTVVCFDEPPKEAKASDQLLFGQYGKKSKTTIALLQELTGGLFKDGAIARILAREFWSRGIAPTYQEFAQAWLEASTNHKQPNPEWAFLSDRANHQEIANWKQRRAKKAKQVMSVLSRLEPTGPRRKPGATRALTE